MPPVANKASEPRLPKCKAIYDWEARDADELNFREGDIIEIVSEGRTKYIYIIYGRTFFRYVCFNISFMVYVHSVLLKMFVLNLLSLFY